MVDTMLREYFGEVETHIKEAIDDAIQTQPDVSLKLVAFIEGESKNNGFGTLRAVIQSKSEVPGTFVTKVLKNLGARDRDATWKHEGHSVFFDISTEYIKNKIMEFVNEDKENDKKAQSKPQNKSGMHLFGQLRLSKWVILALIFAAISVIVTLMTGEVSGSQFKKQNPFLKSGEYSQIDFFVRLLHNVLLFTGKCLMLIFRFSTRVVLDVLYYIYNFILNTLDPIDTNQGDENNNDVKVQEDETTNTIEQSTTVTDDDTTKSGLRTKPKEQDKRKPSVIKDKQRKTATKPN